MFFHSPIFLFIFLPIVLALYFCAGKYSKSAYQYVLIAAGIFFYAWWNIYLTPLIIISIVCNYFFARLIRNSTQAIYKKKILFISSSRADYGLLRDVVKETQKINKNSWLKLKFYELFF